MPIRATSRSYLAIATRRGLGVCDLDFAGPPGSLRRSRNRVGAVGVVATLGNQGGSSTIEATQNIIDSLVGREFSANQLGRAENVRY